MDPTTKTRKQNVSVIFQVDKADLLYTALLWQKEASDKSPKSAKVMFLDWI